MSDSSTTSRSVLITGATGFIGSRLGDALVARGHRVVCVDRAATPGDGSNGHGRMTAVVGDVTDPSPWEHHLDDIDVVVHCAGIHRVDEVDRDPARAVAVNVGGTDCVLSASIERKVDRFVYLSTSKVYGDLHSGRARETDPLAPADRYANTKVEGEALCVAAHERGDIDAVAVRPFSVYGPGQDLRTGYVGALLEAALNHSPASLAGTPEHERDFVHVDAVTGLLTAITEAPRLEHRVWNSGSGQPTTLEALVDTFRAVSGHSADVTYRPPNAGTVFRTSADMTRSHLLTHDRGPTLRDGLRETFDALRRTAEPTGPAT